MSLHTSCVGRLGGDAKLNHTDKGESVLGFSLAVDVGFGANKKTIWLDCSGWGKRFEAVKDYLKKGSQVFVVGEQSERLYEGKAYKTLRLNDLTLVSTKPQGN